jgi:hypothetical protein
MICSFSSPDGLGRQDRDRIESSSSFAVISYQIEIFILLLLLSARPRTAPNSSLRSIKNLSSSYQKLQDSRCIVILGSFAHGHYLPTAKQRIPQFADATVAYLTNCQKSDTGAEYSEVSIYSDVANSFNNEGPSAYADTSLSQLQSWEGHQRAWSFPSLDPNEVDNSNAQDPAVPTFGQVGCASYTEGFSGGAIAFQFNCYKDNPRVLYTTGDHPCSTVYYCSLVHEDLFSPSTK